MNETLSQKLTRLIDEGCEVEQIVECVRKHAADVARNTWGAPGQTSKDAITDALEAM